MSVKQPRKKRKQKVLPVNCNRMMTAGACPLTFWTVIIYKLKGYKVRGWPTLGPFLRTLFPPTGVVCVGKLSPINKKISIPRWTVTAKLLLSLLMLISLSPIILNVIYALYATWTCVSVCVCVRVFSTTCVSWLGAEPCLMIGSWALWCHGGTRKAAVLCSPRARECTCLRVLLTSFPLWMKLVCFSVPSVHLGFLSICPTNVSNILPLVFSLDRGWLLDCIVQRLDVTKISSIVTFF